jgi:hypothetical protein
MEDVMSAPEEITAGNNDEKLLPPPQTEEKLLPPGHPEAIPVPDIQPSQTRAPAPIVITLPEVKPEPLPGEKPLPGPTIVPKNPAMLSAMNMLYTGNAVVAAQAPQETPPPTVSEEAGVESEFDRNLREVGLKESLPHQSNAPEKATAPEKADIKGIRRIRTYADDMGREIQKRGATISSIITAEKALGPSVPEEAPRPHINLLILGTVFFIIFGIGTLSATIYFFTRTPSALPTIETLIPVNKRVALEETDDLAKALTTERNSAKLSLGEVEEVTIVKNGLPVSAPEILDALGAPNELSRNATQVVVGIHAFNHAQPFLIITVSAYDLSFDAVLHWESTMADTLDGFFAPAGAPTHAPPMVFSDKVIANLDARESQSAWPIVYAFPRRNLVILTTNESTLREIVTRLSVGASASQ